LTELAIGTARYSVPLAQIDWLFVENSLIRIYRILYFAPAIFLIWQFPHVVRFYGMKRNLCRKLHIMFFRNAKKGTKRKQPANPFLPCTLEFCKYLFLNNKLLIATLLSF